MKLYLETTVPFALFADDCPHRVAATEAFFKWMKSSSDQIYISTLLEEEISHASASRCALLISRLQKLPLIMLEVPPEASRLAERYLAAGILPEKFRADVLHVAIAVCHGLDVVLSWNIRSVANMRRAAKICEFNERHGLPPIHVHTPEVALSL
jgi:hypothetical protein